MRAELAADPVTLRDLTFPFLRRDPVLHSGHLTGIRDAIHHATGLHGAVAYDGETITGMAAAPAGSRIWLGALPDAAMAAVAAALAPVAAGALTVNGTDTGPAIFAAEWLRLTGRRASLSGRNRLHRLITFTPQAAAGRPRLATSAEAQLCHDWIQHGLPGDLTLRMVSARINAGIVWLWERDGEPVSLAAHHPAMFGAARIGPVCTPPRFRGNGYASALTAHIAGLLRAQGQQVCLYTDLANPTSNKVYAAIGFEPVADYVFRKFH
jgi:GNAT superfamily N-acetyltransferase